MTRMNSQRVFVALLVLLFCAVSSLHADDKKKSSTPAPAKAAPAKAAPATHASGGGAAHPGGASANGGGTQQHGGAANTGPRLNGGSGAGGSHPATGPTANQPGQGKATGPTANQPGQGKATGPTASQPNHGIGTTPSLNNHGGGMAPNNAGRGPNSVGRGPATPVNHGPAGLNRTPMARGAEVHHLQGGSAIQRRPGGRISDVHDAHRGMDIHHGLDGSRRVSMMRPDHSRLVAERGRRGFIERPYQFRGHDFARRNYYYHGRMYSAYYRGYRYRGIDMHVYAPPMYYAPGFYGWVYNPWPVAVSFGWGWGGQPWVGFYGGYFAPYPVYPTASLWLTDYMISSELAAAYEAGKASGNQPPPQEDAQQTALTPEVKQMIADEVKAQVALENAELAQTRQGQEVDPGSSGIARALADGQPHTYVVGAPLDVVDSASNECALTEGDVVQLNGQADGDVASVVVLASKGGTECAKASAVTVALADLQEMQNHMRETIDRGMAELRDKQGKSGLPKAPPSANAAPTQSEYAQIAPPPAPSDEKDLATQQSAADASEQEVTRLPSADSSTVQ
ncbi:MAG: hypothetical protein P4M01_01430 [Acidobacteriota bacterium]|nr:hypothetical protein [Acidobacteriota bacterium]